MKKYCMRKVVVFLIVLWGTPQSIFVFPQEPRNFEGELHYRSLENHDKNIVKYSNGMAYNGARDITIIIKNNITLHRDNCTKITTLLVPGNRIVIYSDILKKGLEFDYTDYSQLYLGAFSSEGPLMPYRATLYSKVKYNPLPPKLYSFKGTEYSAKILDMHAIHVQGRIENTYASTDFDIMKVPDFNMPKSYYAIQLYGINQSGLIAKFIWKQDNKNLLGVLKTYVCTELKRIVERTVDSSEVEIPQEIEIEKGSAIKLVDLYKDTTKYLKKNKMYPTFTQTDVIYKIDDENWDF